jgi:two-component system nitrate/nitrite response regulator NarL
VIRVVLADDHPALRVGLRLLLEREPDIVVVAEADSGHEAIAAILRHLPEVAVLDCQLPGLDGATVAATARRAGCATRIVALSAFSDEATVRAMVDAGATGYLVKDEAPRELVAAVRAVAGGRAAFSPSVAATVAALARGERPGGLTARESAVLRHLARGASNKEIANDLQVTERTVVFHVSNILGKLAVRSRVEAAMWARDHGLS